MKQFQDGFGFLSNVEISRCYGWNLHVFADASNQTYRVLADIQYIINVNVRFCLLCQKKIISNQSQCVTIPKLELSAAIIAIWVKTKLL